MPSKFLQKRTNEAERKDSGNLTTQKIEWGKGMMNADREFIKQLITLERSIEESITLREELLEMQGRLAPESRK